MEELGYTCRSRDKLHEDNENMWWNEMLSVADHAGVAPDLVPPGDICLGGSCCGERRVTMTFAAFMCGLCVEHYGSLGQLADDRQQFEKTVRRDNEDLSVFAIELETLAVKAFEDISPSSRVRMIRDRFVTGHRDCDLRRHLDSVLPGTSIRDIVDRCRVRESNADADDRSFVKPAPERTRSVYMVSELAVMPTDRVVVAVATP